MNTLLNCSRAATKVQQEPTEETEKEGAYDGKSVQDPFAALGQVYTGIGVTGEDVGRVQIHGRRQAAWHDPADAGVRSSSVCSCACGTSPRSRRRASSVPRFSWQLSLLVYGIRAGRCQGYPHSFNSSSRRVKGSPMHIGTFRFRVPAAAEGFVGLNEISGEGVLPCTARSSAEWELAEPGPQRSLLSASTSDTLVSSFLHESRRSRNA